MTKNKILNRIDELETERFYLAMKDHWTAFDNEQDTKMFQEIRKLKIMLDK